MKRQGVFKNDNEAQARWGRAYSAIPKSVFAITAWHLANVASGSADADGAAESRFREEVSALASAGLITPNQFRAAMRALFNKEVV